MKRRVMFSLLLCFAFAAQGLWAQPKEGGGEKKKKKETYIADKVKDFEKSEGLFTFYQDPKDGTTYMVVKKDQVGKEFIHFNYIADGVIGASHFRGQYRGSKIFTIQKHFNKLEFVAENTSYYFDEKNPISRAKDANISHAILTSQKIEANDSLETEYLIKADPLFLNENVASVKPNYPRTYKGYKLGNLSKSKSKYVDIRAYPENADVIVEYVYENKAPQGSPGSGTTDARFMSVKVQHSFIAVPENDFEPRFDDPRIGYFMTQVTDLSSTEATPYRDMIHRWHLKKKKPGSRMSEPVEPIVWWIENTTPNEIRGVIKKSVEAWNLSFEKIGFKNAVQVKVQPDDADWDAGDIRYNVLRWTSSPRVPFGGYGPSFVNPRTGQILGADVMLEFSFMTNRLNAEKIFSEAALESFDENLLFEGDHQYCMLGNHLQMSNLFGLTALKAVKSPNGDESKLLEESLYYLMLHEVGHTLGLNHNMKSSQMLSPTDVHNESVTTQRGLTGSVMDYPAINFALNQADQGQYYTTLPGPYDDWAIEYGYSQAAKNSQKEQARLDAILARSTDPALTFGNDADDMRSPGKALDPRINTGDMSSDAIGYMVDRIKLTQKVSQDLRANLTEDDKSYHELRNAYFIMTGQHSSSLRVISRYIGGVYVDRAFHGQEGGTKPFRPVSGADQKRAMESLSKFAFAPDAFDTPNDLYNYLQGQRRGFNHFGAPEDPKIHDRVLNIQRGVLAHLLHRNVMKRMTDTQLYGNDYSLAAMMDDLTSAIFDADKSGGVNDFRKNLQVEYVNRLARIIGEKGKSNYDYVSQGLAYAHLKKIREMLKNSASDDMGTSAHRTYLSDLISMRFDAM